ERGQSDPVLIELPKGTYDPLISRGGGSGESGAAPSEANVTPKALGRSRPLRWQWAVAVTLVVAVLTGVWWFDRNVHQTSGRLVGMRQVTNSAAADLSPAFSPDGSQIAFASNRTGHFEIYVRSLALGAT